MTQCTATSRNTGEQCKLHASRGRTTCRFHGGATPVGKAASNYKDGKRSRYNVPMALRDAYEAALNNPDINSLKDDIALIEARINDLLSRPLAISPTAIWKELESSANTIHNQAELGNTQNVFNISKELIATINAGKDQMGAWEDVYNLSEQRRKAVLAQHKIEVELEVLTDIKKVMGNIDTLVNVLTNVVRKHVEKDTAILIVRAVMGEYATMFQRHREQPIVLENGL